MYDDFPNKMVNAVGAVFLSYGFIGLLSGRMERWMAYGFLAVGQVCFGLMSTVDGSYPWAAFSAGLVAFDAFIWWNGGGEKQVAQLRQRMARKGGDV